MCHRCVLCEHVQLESIRVGIVWKLASCASQDSRRVSKFASLLAHVVVAMFVVEASGGVSRIYGEEEHKAFETFAWQVTTAVADVSCSLQYSCTRQRNELQSVDRYTCGTPHFSHAQSFAFGSRSVFDVAFIHAIGCCTRHALPHNLFLLRLPLRLQAFVTHPLIHCGSTAGCTFCGLPTSHTKCLFCKCLSAQSRHIHNLGCREVSRCFAERFVLTMFGVASRILGSAVGSFHGGRDRSQSLV